MLVQPGPPEILSEKDTDIHRHSHLPLKPAAVMATSVCVCDWDMVLNLLFFLPSKTVQ